jgi:hypothetical protein
MNINMLRDADNDAGFYAAASSADARWPGAVLYRSVDNGVSYQQVATFTAAATMGRTLNALGAFSGGFLPDEINTIKVSLTRGTLSSVAYASFLAGVQAALVGDEIVYFRNAVLNADGTYTVSGFLRGLRGSEFAMGQHVSGERFVLLDPATIKRIPGETADLHVPRLYKAVTVGSTLAKATAQSFTNDGAGLRPYAPVQLGGGFAANGDALLSWTRRSRISGEWRNGVDVPLGEDSEAYEVEIWDAGFASKKRTISGLSAPSAVYSAADQAIDFGSAQSVIHFRVYQLSAVIGRGYGAQGTVPATVTTPLAADDSAAPVGDPAPTPDPTPVPVPDTRDPMLQPFASSSIWNMPIGSGAVYVPANLNPNPAPGQWTSMPGSDDEHIILAATAPVTNINHSSGGWGGNRCVYDTTILTTAPIPSSYVMPNSNDNDGAAILLADGRTIRQMQPFARCTAGGPATAMFLQADVDLYGPGITGAHGGSGLSSIGGCLRLGELRPGVAPKHALKVNVYAKQALYKATSAAQAYRWPATTGDGYAVGWYGIDGNNSNTAMKMGALLAIPATTDIDTLGFETAPALLLAWTLQNYGAYIVDDTYAPGFAFSVEEGPSGKFTQQFQGDWGFAFDGNLLSPNAWSRDMQRIMSALYVVDNNSASSIGGGGTPRQPLAPAI